MGEGRVVVGDLPAAVHNGVEKAIDIQQSAVSKYVQRLRRVRPDATPAQIVSALERRYLAAVTGAGAALGAAAAVPGAGTGLALVLSAGETAMFLETTTLFTLAIAEVHAIRIEDADRRTLVLTVALADGGAMLVEKPAGQTGEHWGRLLTDLIPMSSISAINKALWHWFVTQHPRKRTAIGKVAPFGIGAGLAAAGNLAFGRMVINASRRVFGPPPANFDGATTIVDSPRETLPPTPHPAPAARDDELPVPRQPSTRPQPSTSGELFVPSQPVVPAQLVAPVTGKYRPLFDYLVARDTDHLEIRFSDIEALVTGGLPKSASTKTWWSNSSNSRQAIAWLSADFEVTDIDIGSGTVRFTKRNQH